MFITVLLIIEKKKKARNNQSIDKRIDTLQYIHKIEYFPAVIINKLKLHILMWPNFKKHTAHYLQ